MLSLPTLMGTVSRTDLYDGTDMLITTNVDEGVIDKKTWLAFLSELESKS